MGNKQDPQTYGETYADVISKTALKRMLVDGAVHDKEMMAFDITGAFRKTEIDDGTEILARIPKGWPGITPGMEKTHCFRLKKWLYGIVEAPRRYQMKYAGTIKDLGFTVCIKDNNAYRRKEPDGSLTLTGTHVDDGLISAKRKQTILDLVSSIFMHGKRHRR
jgi:hypothetical protein